MSRKLALIALLIVASPANAFDTSKLGQGGSLLLSDLDSLIGQSASLRREVDEALARVGKKADDVICSGYRFPSQWTNLGGLRVSPYTCDFKEKWLLIKATVRITGPGRKVYEQVSRAAMKGADNVTETNPTWSWTTDDPFADKK